MLGASVTGATPPHCKMEAVLTFTARCTRGLKKTIPSFSYICSRQVAAVVAAFGLLITSGPGIAEAKLALKATTTFGNDNPKLSLVAGRSAPSPSEAHTVLDADQSRRETECEAGKETTSARASAPALIGSTSCLAFAAQEAQRDHTQHQHVAPQLLGTAASLALAQEQQLLHHGLLPNEGHNHDEGSSFPSASSPAARRHSTSGCPELFSIATPREVVEGSKQGTEESRSCARDEGEGGRGSLGRSARDEVDEDENEEEKMRKPPKKFLASSTTSDDLHSDESTPERKAKGRSASPSATFSFAGAGLGFFGAGSEKTGAETTAARSSPEQENYQHGLLSDSTTTIRGVSSSSTSTSSIAIHPSPATIGAGALETDDVEFGMEKQTLEDQNGGGKSTTSRTRSSASSTSGAVQLHGHHQGGLLRTPRSRPATPSTCASSTVTDFFGRCSPHLAADSRTSAARSFYRSTTSSFDVDHRAGKNHGDQQGGVRATTYGSGTRLRADYRDQEAASGAGPDNVLQAEEDGDGNFIPSGARRWDGSRKGRTDKNTSARRNLPCSFADEKNRRRCRKWSCVVGGCVSTALYADFCKLSTSIAPMVNKIARVQSSFSKSTQGEAAQFLFLMLIMVGIMKKNV